MVPRDLADQLPSIVIMPTGNELNTKKDEGAQFKALVAKKFRPNAAHEHAYDVQVDLQHVTQWNSAGINVLLWLKKQEYISEVVLTNVTEELRKTLGILRLDQVFQIHG